MDIIAAIDEATGCQHCRESLGSSPSDDFCNEGCQAAWHAERVGGEKPGDFKQAVAELARQLDPETWTVGPQLNVGDRMMIQWPTGHAEVFAYDGQRWQFLGEAAS